MFWSKVWQILVEECGASQDDMGFISRQGDFVEWRFIGALGFGGKVWKNRGQLYVNCYHENETPERLSMIKRANRRLADLITKNQDGRVKDGK